RSRVEELEREMRSARRDAVTRADYERLTALLEQKVSQKRLSEIEDYIADLDKRKLEQAQLDAVARQVTAELQEVRSSLDVPRSQALDYSETNDMLDAFYASFEDRFRGRPAEIKERVQVYVPI